MQKKISREREKLISGDKGNIYCQRTSLTSPCFCLSTASLLLKFLTTSNWTPEISPVALPSTFTIKLILQKHFHDAIPLKILRCLQSCMELSSTCSLCLKVISNCVFLTHPQYQFWNRIGWALTRCRGCAV